MRSNDISQSPGTQRAKLACGISMMVATIVVISHVGLPQADPSKFMDSHSVRRLFVPDLAKQVQTNFTKFESENNDFHGYRDRGFRDELCAPYNGIDQLNDRGCCHASCGEFCGTSECYRGEGGHAACCEGSFKVFCGPGVNAPCLLNTTVLAHKFHDLLCLKYEGIDDRHDGACCPPDCGEFCGSDYCGEGQTDSKCCASRYTERCVEGQQNAPCLLPLTLSYPGAKNDAGHEVHLGKQVMLLPELGIGHPTSFTVTPALPEGLELDRFSGVISGAISKDLEYTAQKYRVVAKDAAGSAIAQISFVVNPASGGVSYPAADAQFTTDDNVRLTPEVTGGLPSSYSITPSLPEGLELDATTGVIQGAFKKDQKELDQKYVLTVKNSAGQATSEFSLHVKKGLEAPGDFIYRAKGHFAPGGSVKLLPRLTGGHPSSFTIKPALPKGLKLDTESGEIQGVADMEQKGGEHKYIVTAKNAAGEGTSEFSLGVLYPPGTLSYPAPANGVFAPGEKVNLSPSFKSGGEVDSFKVKPALPKGLKIDDKTGVIQGQVDSDEKSREEKYEVTAKNAAGETTTEFLFSVLVAPAAMTYADAVYFTPGAKVDLAGPSGGQIDGFAIEPALPVGLKLDPATGEIHGALEKSQTPSDLKFVVTAKNAVGESKSNVILHIKAKAKPQAGGFPWWIVVVILILLVVAFFVFRKKPEESSYKAVPVAEPAPQPAREPAVVEPPAKPPPGLALTFATSSGDKTVYATQKPLGLQFEQKLPITITHEREGHGKDIGVKVGWTLKMINSVDISNTSARFEEVDKYLHAEVSKLDGTMKIPLLWNTPSGERTVFASFKPLGLVFDKGKLPIKITREIEGHGKDIGVQEGWELKSVNYVDISNLTVYSEVEAILHGNINKLQKKQ